MWSRGSPVAEHAPLAPREILRAHPHLTVTAITPFGLEGPWSDKPATEFTLQAWSGAIVGLARGRPDRAPVFVGGQIGEWLSGVFGAIGTLAARRRSEPGGELIDVSMLEALAMCLTYYPVTFHDQLGRPMRRRRFVPTPGVGAASDGLVGLGCGTGQQWLDFCAMVGHPEWMEDPKLFLGPHGAGADDRRLDRRAHSRRGARPRVAFRIPNAPIANGSNVTTFEHFRARETFVANPRDGAANPRPPFRLGSSTPPGPERGASARRALHRCGRNDATWRSHRDDGDVAGASVRGPAGPGHDGLLGRPARGHLLALLGAEVIHLESSSRPDGARLVGGVPQTEDRSGSGGRSSPRSTPTRRA